MHFRFACVFLARYNKASKKVQLMQIFLKAHKKHKARGTISARLFSRPYFALNSFQ